MLAAPQLPHAPMLSTLILALLLAPLGAQTAPGADSTPAQASGSAAASTEDLPAGASLRLGTRRMLHPTRVMEAVFSPDGTWFVTGAEDGIVRRWNSADGAPQGEFDARGYGAVVALSISADGKSLAVGTRHQCLQVFDLESGARTFVRPETGSLPAWRPDTSDLLVGEYGPMLRVVDPQTAEVTREIDHSPYTVEEVVVSPCDRFVAVRALNRMKLLRRGGTEGQARSAVFVRDAQTLEILGTLEFDDATALAMAFDPSGERLYVGDDLGRVDQYDPVHQKELGLLAGDGQGIFSLAVDLDGKTLSLARLGGVVDRVDTQSMERSGQWLRSRLAYDRLRVQPGVGTLLGVSAGVVDLRRASDGEAVLAPARHLNVVTSLAFSADGEFIASGAHDSSARIWRSSNGNPVGEPLFHGGWVFDVAWLPGSARLATACRDGGIYLWDVLGSPQGERLEASPLGVTSIDVDPDGKRLIAGIAEGTLIVLGINADGAQGAGSVTTEGKIEGLGGIEPSVRFAESGSRGLAAGADLRVYDFDKLAEAGTLGDFGAPIGCLDVSSDGRFAAVGLADGVVRVIEIEGARRRPPMVGHVGRVSSVAFSPDGRRLASVSEFDDTVLIFEVATSKVADALAGQGSPLSSLAYSPDGKCIATGAFDGTILVWDVEL